MILQALVRRYEDTQQQTGEDVTLVPPGWKKRGVTHALDISEAGELLDVVPLEWEEVTAVGKKEKKTLRRRELVLPDTGVVSSGIRAGFLCDNASYWFGLDEKRGQAKFAAAQEMHRQMLEGVDTPQVRAILAWFAAGILPHEVEMIRAAIPEKKLGQAMFVFQVDGGPLVDIKNAAIRTAWDGHNATADTEPTEGIRCLVTGRLDTPQPVHNKVKLRGGQAAGSSLVSANENSYGSYGKTKSDPAADIGTYAAFAHVTALNDLLASRTHSKPLAGDTLVYWAADNSEAEVKAFNAGFDPQLDEDDGFWSGPVEDDESHKLDSIAKHIADIRHIDKDKCNMSRPFYLLCLSPNASRVMVRFFHANIFGDVMDKLQAHYDHITITPDRPNKSAIIPYWILLNETTVTKKSDKVAPLLGGLLVHSILQGSRYPQTLYNAIMLRVRANETINQTKAAIIKAVLIRNYNEQEVTTVSLNTQSSNKPYVLGRLFAVLERQQERAADTKLNTTIRDRYFARACANPGSVFPTILRLSMHHAAKNDSAGYVERDKQDIMNKLEEGTPFPPALALDDQGRFILGYYHQRQSFFTKKEEAPQ